MNTEQERADFEAWAASIGFCDTGKYAETINVLCAESAFKAGYRAARTALQSQEPVGEVRIENDYWSRGHFYEGKRKEAKLLAAFHDLPVGTKLYAAPVAAQENPKMPPLTEAMRAVLRNENDVYGNEDELYVALCDAVQVGESALAHAHQYLSLTDAMGYDSTSGLSPEEWAARLSDLAQPVVNQQMTTEQDREDARWLVFNVGCIECGVSSDVVGVFASEEEAERVAAICSKALSWREGGQNSFEVFDLQSEQASEYSKAIEEARRTEGDGE